MFGPGSARSNDCERYFLAETLYDRRQLFWLDNSRLAKRARRLGIVIPDVIDDQDELVDEVAFSSFRREVNAAQLVEFKRWIDVILPPLGLIVTLAAVLATYSGNRRYNALEALLTERTTRLETQIKVAKDSATALEVRVQELSDQVSRLADNKAVPLKPVMKKRRVNQASKVPKRP